MHGRECKSWRSGARATGSCICLAACLAAQAAPPQWFRLDRPSPVPHTIVEVDLRSRDVVLGEPLLRLRVTPVRALRHPDGGSYRSYLAVVRIDCAARVVVPLAVTYYRGGKAGGREVAVESDLRADGISEGLLDTVPRDTRAALVRASCAPG